MSAAGAKIEAPYRRRGGRGVGRGVPLPTGEGVWGGGTAPSPENVLILALRMVGFGSFWVAFFKVELFVLHAKISVLRLPSAVF